MALRRTSSLRSLLSARLYQPSSGSIIRRDHEEKWASVLLAIFLIRGLTIPFMISTARLYSRVAVSRILQRQKNYLESKDQGRDPATVARIQREHDDMVKEFKICKYPYLFAVPYICAIPFLLECMDTAVQEMTMNVPSFKTGGALWFTDLTSPDAFYILPILTGLIFWIGVEREIVRSRNTHQKSMSMNLPLNRFSVSSLFAHAFPISPPSSFVLRRPPSIRFAVVSPSFFS